MNWLEMLFTSGQALWQHKLRTGLSMLGIVFAVMAVIAMLAMAEGAKRETLEQIGQLGTQNIIVRQAALTQGQEAAAVLERLVSGMGAVAGASKDALLEVLAVTAAYPRALSLDLAQGRFIAPLDVAGKNQACVLGWELARLLGSQGLLGGMVTLEDRPFWVVGILRERRWVRGKSAAIAARNYNRTIFVLLGAEPAPRLGDKREPELSEILLRMDQASQVSAAAAVAACHQAGIGLTAMKDQGGGPVKSDSEAEVKMAGCCRRCATGWQEPISAPPKRPAPGGCPSAN